MKTVADHFFAPLPISAPKLMPFQDLPFNGDSYAIAKVKDLIKEYGLTVAIETGTCFGSTTQFFIQSFDFTCSIESNQKYFRIASERLSAFKEAHEFRLFNNSSAAFLTHAINEFCFDLPFMDKKDHERGTLFFLDAHWERSCPLIDELRQIADYSFRNKPVIMIHDFFIPGRPDLGYDSYNGQPFTFEWIKPHVDAIYGKQGYEIEYNNKAEGAKRGIIYITPKRQDA